MTDIALPDAGALWADARERLIGHLSDVAQRTWLAETVPVGCDGETLVLAAPHSFAREQLDNRYAGLVRAALAQAAGRHLDVVVTIRTRLDAEPERSDAEALPDVVPPPTAEHAHAGTPTDTPRLAATCTTATRSTASSSGPATTSRGPPPSRSPRPPPTATTRCSSSAARGWARPTSCRPSATTPAASTRTCGCATSAPSSSPTSSSTPSCTAARARSSGATATSTSCSSTTSSSWRTRSAPRRSSSTPSTRCTRPHGRS